MTIEGRRSARALELRTIAECVESSEILDKLCDFGVDFARGYHVGKPGPVEELAPIAL